MKTLRHKIELLLIKTIKVSPFDSRTRMRWWNQLQRVYYLRKYQNFHPNNKQNIRYN